MFFEKDDFDYRFILILIIFPRVNFLKEISSFTAILPDKPRSIAYKEFPALISKLGSSDVSIVLTVM